MFDKNKVKLGIAPIAWTNDDLSLIHIYPVWTDAADYKRSGRIPERDLLCEYENCLGYRYTE